MSSYKVGSHVSEGVAKGTNSVGVASKRNIGLIGSFIRGVPNTPIKITSPEQFNTIFGGQSASYFGPAVVKSLFDEAGDADVCMYILRINDAGQAATGAMTIPALSGTITATITAAHEGVADVGSWGNSVKVYFYSKDSRSSGNYRLEVVYNDDNEVFDGASLAEIQNLVNSNSNYISITFSATNVSPATLTALTGTVATTLGSNVVTGTGTTFTTDLQIGQTLYNKTTGEEIGVVASITSATSLTLTTASEHTATAVTAATGVDYSVNGELSGGTDVDRDMSAEDFTKFDGVDVQIMTFTENHTLANAVLLNNYVSKRQDPLGLVIMPLNSTKSVAKLWRSTLVTNDTSFLAVYNLWVTVYDHNYNKILIPGNGTIIGSAYLRNAHAQGNGIHIPPGGTDGAFKNVLSISPNNLSQDDVDVFVQQYFINVVRYDRNYGYYVASSRTMSNNSLYMSVHIRLQTSYYKRYLESILLPYIQKPSTPELKNAMLVDCRSFFKNEYDAGALERSLSFDNAYKGICDLSNNPRTQDRKLTNVDVLWVPTECTEAIHLRLLRNDSILTITEEA